MRRISRSRIASAVGGILAAHAAAAIADADSQAPAGAAVAKTELEEVVVTATRRTENLQDVPLAITALTNETLNRLNIQTLDDYAKYLSNVTVMNQGPGQSEIYMRGLAASQTANQASAAFGIFPNVAVYLDDQSVALPGRNLDVYAADMERIEVLEGPQGTLYGAGAQAGAVRYITNKPNHDKVEAGFNASYATTAHGGPSSGVSAFLNMPITPETLAVRLVIYDDERGGYIHNIPGTFAREPTDLGIVDYFGGQRVLNTVITPGVVPPGSPTINNSSLVNPEYNPATYKGARASADVKFNADWSLLLQENYQDLETEGVFGYTPSLGDLNVQQYNQSSSTDRYTDTAWTLTGKIGQLKLVYTGGYLDRNVNQIQDYTAYARGIYAAYYQCNGPSLPMGTGKTNVCYSPSGYWHDVVRNTHESHELRLSTPDDWRLRGIVGLFYEDYKIYDLSSFLYADVQAGFEPQRPYPGTTMIDPSIRPPGTAFFNDLTRGYQQRAVFGDLSYDIVPHTLTLSAGARYYQMPTFAVGSTNTVYGCRGAPAGTCTGLSASVDADHDQITYTGTKPKYTLSWKVTDDAMVYSTYSEGFRPGGFNGTTSVITSSSPLYGVFVQPKAYGPDTLKNIELGWKTTWLNHRLQFNGAVYQENWDNVQVVIFAPALYGNNNFNYNGPDYRVRGLESSLAFLPVEGLSINASASWNSSSQQSNPTLLGNNGQVIALVPTAGIGSTLAQCPPFQGNARVRYEFPFQGYVYYGQVGAQHTAHSYASIITAGAYESPRQNLDPYSTYDAALGLVKDSWMVEAYGENLTDVRAQLFISGADWVQLVTTNRPRTFGMRVSYKF
jgi:iron complex outermembrane recepter protein